MKRAYKIKLDLSDVELKKQVVLNSNTCDKVVDMAASIVTDGLTTDSFIELSKEKETIPTEQIDLGYE